MSELPYTSIKFANETKTHWIYKCPFCGEEHVAKFKRKHAHLYISKKTGVFFCFRCNESGNYLKLENFIHEKSKVPFTNTITYDLQILDIPTILDQMNIILESYSIYITDNEKEYFKNRTKIKHDITIDDIIRYNLFPDYYARGILYNEIFSKINYDEYRTWVIKGLGTGLAGRSHNAEKCLRYINGETVTPWSKFINNDCYFIRNNVIKKYDRSHAPLNLIIAEGVYDIIPIYINHNKYMINNDNSMFTAVQCSNYARALKLYLTMYNQFPKNVIIFADSGISLELLKKQFLNAKNKTNIMINWPCVKDWEETGPIRCNIKI